MENFDYSKTSTELKDWFGVQNAYFVVTVIILYLLTVLKILPSYMKNRDAYKLKTFITIYNVTQLIACVYVIKMSYKVTSFKIYQFWECISVPSNSPKEYAFNRLMYFVFWLKISELSETIVFVLRKNQRQVSFLHVFHHCTTVSLLYMMIAYYRGVSGLYPIFLNSHVHILMYTYYLASALCSKDIVKLLLPFKKFITITQMVQFTLILMQVVFLYYKCNLNPIIVGYYSIVVIVIYHGFYNFYKKSYNKK